MKGSGKWPLTAWFGVDRYRSDKVAGRLYNQYYIDFPQTDYDRRFKFPRKLVSLRRPESGSRISTISPDRINVYGFYIDEGICGDINIQSSNEFDVSVLYLGLSLPPEDMDSGFHGGSVLHFLSADGKKSVAVGRVSLIVIQKWKDP